MATRNKKNSIFRKYPDVVGIKQLCQMLGIGMNKAYELVNSGKVQRIPCGHTIRVTKVSVIEYVLQNEQNSE